MSISEIDALIEFAKEVHQAKQDKAGQELLSEFRERVSAIGLSLEELLSQKQAPTPATKEREKKGKKLQAKYRGPNGDEWTGRGRTPKWLAELEAQGQGRDNFKI